MVEIWCNIDLFIIILDLHWHWLKMKTKTNHSIFITYILCDSSPNIYEMKNLATFLLLFPVSLKFFLRKNVVWKSWLALQFVIENGKLLYMSYNMPQYCCTFISVVFVLVWYCWPNSKLFFLYFMIWVLSHGNKHISCIYGWYCE